MQPAIYSRTPVPVANRTFSDTEDNIARLATLKLERLANYLIRCCPFDRVQYATRDDFLHTGKATNRICFDSKIGNRPKKIYYVQIPDPNWVPPPPPPPPQAQPQPQDGSQPDQGQPQGMMPPPQEQQPPPPMMPPAPPPQPPLIWVNDEGEQPQGQLMQDEQGVYEESTEEYIEEMSCELLPVYYYDILHTPNARYWEEIDWIAFKANMTKPDVREKFGAEIANALTYTPINRDDSEDRKSSDNTKDTIVNLYAEVWEIWDKRTKKVIWLDTNYKEDFLKVEDDLYELEGFFPCPPFMLGTIGAEDLYAVPDFSQLEPIINQVNAMAKRLQGVIRATKRKGIYDASVPELADLANDTAETEFLGMKNLGNILGDANLDKIIKFFPTQEFVNAAKELAESLQMYESKFYEIYGIPDILRGVTDPQETAAAQQLKGQYTSLRFSAVQREFQRLVANSIQLMCDLALKKFDEDKLREIMGVNYDSQEDQQAWPQVLLLLQDDDERKVRIDIETDSTITMNQNEDIEQRNYLAKTVFDGLSAVATASQQNPQFAQAAMSLLTYVTRGLRYGKEIEEDIMKISKQMQEAANNPAPPPPDPEIIKAQAHVQAQQVRMQADQQIEQTKAQAEIAREDRKAQARIATDQAAAQNKMQIQQMQAGFDKMKMDHQAQINTMQSMFEMKMKQLEVMAEAHKTMKESGQAFTGGPPPAVHLNVGPAPRPTRRVGRIVRDANGDAIGIESQDVPDENVSAVNLPGLG